MEELVPELAKRVLPASSCMIATEVLSQELANSVLPQNVAVCDPRTALDYFRLSADNRLLFGGLSNYTGLVPNNYAQIMQRKMLQIFRSCRAQKIEFAWDGQMGIGLNRMPQLGKLGDNIYYIQAYSGQGVAPTHMMARIIAEAINGNSARFDMMSKIRHWPFPGGRYLRRPAWPWVCSTSRLRITVTQALPGTLAGASSAGKRRVGPVLYPAAILSPSKGIDISGVNSARCAAGVSRNRINISGSIPAVKALS